MKTITHRIFVIMSVLTTNDLFYALQREYYDDGTFTWCFVVLEKKISQEEVEGFF